MTLLVEGKRITVRTLTNLRPSFRSKWNMKLLGSVEKQKPKNIEKSPRSKASKRNPKERPTTTTRSAGNGSEVEGESLSTAPPELSRAQNILDKAWTIKNTFTGNPLEEAHNRQQSGIDIKIDLCR